jgi:hypothetical protein
MFQTSIKQAHAAKVRAALAIKRIEYQAADQRAAGLVGEDHSAAVRYAVSIRREAAELAMELAMLGGEAR